MSKPRYLYLSKVFPQREKGICAYCGGKLPGFLRRWCTEECQTKAYIETNYGYWQRDLAEMRGFKCGECGRELYKGWGMRDYDIHHITPFAECGHHRMDNLLVLCKECHKLEHAKLLV